MSAFGPITVGDKADEAVVARLGREISALNFATTGIRDGRWLYAAVHDDDGELAGAIDGWTWGGTAWIEHLWVHERHRGRRLGTDLLAAAEAEARARGCTQMALTTHSFQAPDFYRRHGFEVAGEVRGYPAGHAYLLMRRELSPAARG
jgi:ribosomal protein S18 acetylase RimI-like enzyme